MKSGIEFLQRVNKDLWHYYDKKILSNVPSQVYLDSLNAHSPKDFFDIFWKLDPMGTASLSENPTPEDWQDIKNAQRSPEDFAKSKIGMRFMEAQEQLRKAVETQPIFTSRGMYALESASHAGETILVHIKAPMSDSILGITLKPSLAATPSIRITPTDPFTLIFTRLVIDIIGGKVVYKCAAKDCGIFAISKKRGSLQKFHSHACQLREWRRQKK